MYPNIISENHGSGQKFYCRLPKKKCKFCYKKHIGKCRYYRRSFPKRKDCPVCRKKFVGEYPMCFKCNMGNRNP